MPQVMSGGFYLMHRGWMDNPIFRREKFTEREAWESLIHDASFEPRKIRRRERMVEVQRGQVPTDYRALKEKWRWSNDRVRSFLSLLESEGMITREIGTGSLIISICKYDKYQVSLRNIGTHFGTQTGTQTGTTYIEKEIKELEITIPSLRARDPELTKRIFRWLELFFKAPRPYISAPITAWLEWGAEFEKDIKPAAENFLKRGKGPPGSLEWLGEIVARSIKQRQTAMPEVQAVQPRPMKGQKHANFAEQDYRTGTDGFDLAE